MKKKSVLIFSIIVFIMPFLGFPSSWKTIFFMLLALAIVFATYREGIIAFFSVPQEPRGRLIQGDSYVESTGGTMAS